jgi:beta-N-acetylhexosaminidase
MNKNLQLHIALLSTMICLPLHGDAQELLNKLSLHEKLGQLIMIAMPSNPEDPANAERLAQLNLPTNLNTQYARQMITNYLVGGILFICEGKITPQIIATNEFQQTSRIPLFIAQDFEPGLEAKVGGLNRLQDLIKFPRNMTIGAVQNLELVQRLGQIMGQQARRMGVNVIFAPVVDINSNPENPIINERSFGDSPQAVAAHGVAFMKGVQEQGVIAVGKHAPGHGDTKEDSHLKLPTIPHDRARFDEVELVPFKAIIEAGIHGLMTAHSMVPCFDNVLPASLSPAIITNLFKKELGFNGLIFSDGMTMKAITDNYGEAACLKAFKAGTHIIVFPANVSKTINTLKIAIMTGKISISELNTRVLKILEAKEQIFGPSMKAPLIDPQTAVNDINSREAQHIKKELYENAITITRNKKTIPCKATALVCIGGEKENDFVQKIRSLAPRMKIIKLPNDPSANEIKQLLEKIKNEYEILITLFGTSKYASEQFGIKNNARNLVNLLCKKKKSTLVLLSSVYSLPLFNDSNATTIMAYETDPEAQKAAAKVVMGACEARGKLPVTMLNNRKKKVSKKKSTL